VIACRFSLLVGELKVGTVGMSGWKSAELFDAETVDCVRHLGTYTVERRKA
jgi:hypothetical protein